MEAKQQSVGETEVVICFTTGAKEAADTATSLELEYLEQKKLVERMNAKETEMFEQKWKKMKLALTNSQMDAYQRKKRGIYRHNQRRWNQMTWDPYCPRFG